jgi:hypothetical protein
VGVVIHSSASALSFASAHTHKGWPVITTAPAVCPHLSFVRVRVRLQQLPLPILVVSSISACVQYVCVELLMKLAIDY